MKSSKRKLCIRMIVFLGTLCFTAALFGQTVIYPGTSQLVIQNAPKPEERMRLYDEYVKLKDRSPFKDMRWSWIGPTNISGRVTDIAVVTPKGKNYTIYIAVSSGGVWKTDNEGTTWRPIFEQAPTASIGDVTIAPSDPNIVWVGTGEQNIFRSSHPGAGVYKSTDAGATWQYTGLAGTQTIARIIIHPKDPNTVYVAGCGHEWTFNEDRGIFKTTDGGKTWKKILYINDQTGANDIIMDPTNSSILYASMWQRIRRKWNDPRIEPGFKESGIYKTTDGGNTWKPINTGLPAPEFRGRIGIDLCLKKPNVLYAFLDNYETIPGTARGTDSYGRPITQDRIKGATVYRSDDAGENWAQVSNVQQLSRTSGTYGWVFSQVRVDPNNPDKVYIMGVSANVSIDGGKNFSSFQTAGGDHHAMWIDPDNSNYIITGYDQGVCITYDGGRNSRDFVEQLPTSQFYNVAYDMDTPFRVYGSVQDHGSRRAVVTVRVGRDSIRTFQAVAFENTIGGEGTSHAIETDNPNIVYASSYYGRVQRADYSQAGGGGRGRGGQTRNIDPTVPISEPPLRGQWVAPTIISPHNPRIVYHGFQYLYWSINRGDSWERISLDLTYNTASEMGDIPYHTLFAISESPFKYGLIYTGSDDGKVYVTKDGGRTWKEIMRGLPYQKWVSKIVASQYDEATVYMSQTGKQDDDFTPYLWKSTDYGETWVSIAQGIPLGGINAIREDPQNKNILYAGTDGGVYVSTNGGMTWNVLGSNLPTVYVNDLIVHPRDNILVIATYGRGMWAIDIAPIQKSMK